MRHDAGIGHDFAVVADLDVGVDECERMYGDVISELGGRIDVC